MLFLLSLADRLHKTLEEIMELSTFEVRLWAAYLKVIQNNGR